MALHEQGRLDEADVLYDRFIAAYPEHRQAIRLHAILARQCAEHDRSIELLKRLGELAPGDAVPVCELGLTHLARGDLFAAEQALREAVELDPGSLPARVNLGAVLQRRGYFSAAAEQYRQGLELAPDDIEIRFNLANTLMEAGHGDDALAAIDAALAREPDQPVALASRGAILCALERYADAIDVLERAAPAASGDDMALINLAFACRHEGKPDAAAAVLETAVRINPANARAVADLANAELELGRVDAALGRCRDFLDRYPGERLVLAAYGVALTAAGRHEEARTLNDYDRLVTIIDAAAPAGFDDIEHFNAALSEFVLAHPSRLADPVRKSTTGGSQTGELDASQDPVLAAFVALAEDAAARTVERWLALGYGAHPLMAYAADNRTLRLWGTVLEARGFQSPHSHPLGWFSGVYYARIPDGMRDADVDAGALEFGALPAQVWSADTPERRRVAPAAGRFVLFPSWFYHRTLPFTAPAPRISLAFDFVPLAD